MGVLAREERKVGTWGNGRDHEWHILRNAGHDNVIRQPTERREKYIENSQRQPSTTHRRQTQGRRPTPKKNPSTIKRLRHTKTTGPLLLTPLPTQRQSSFTS